MTEPGEPIPVELKRAALESVLESRTFERGDQLRVFLKYVCEQEWSGRAGEITEYSIGVEALGRPRSFNPVEDSIVRNRAHAVRKKLSEFYSGERPDAELLVELPRGSYVPRYVTREKTVVPAPVSELSPRRDTRVVDAEFVPSSRMAAFFGFVGGAAITAVVAALFWMGARPGLNSTVREFWGPVVEGHSPVLVCLTAPPQLFVRQLPNPLERGGDLVASAEIQSAIARTLRVSPQTVFYLLPTLHSPLLGDSLALASATRVLGQAGVPYEILTEQVTNMPNLRGRSAILAGRAEYSPLVRRLLESLPLGIDFDPSSREMAVWDRTSRRVIHLPGRGRDRSIKATYGLLTVLPGEGTPDTRERIIVFSGVSSSGTQAAAEFFASPAGLAQLRVALKGSVQPPYQAVLRAENENNLPVNIKLVDVRRAAR